MADCTGWRAAASTRGTSRRWSANAGWVDPLGLEMLIMLFGGLVVAVRLGFYSCQQVYTWFGRDDRLTWLLILLTDANHFVNVVFVQSSLHNIKVILFICQFKCIYWSVDTVLPLPRTNNPG